MHGDLSEYNLLYHENDAFWIDVSQSVEHDHPHALEFLRKDCMNVNLFFMKNNVSVLTTKELFDFVTDPSITGCNIEECIASLMEKASQRSPNDFTAEEKISEEVFMKSFIPKSLDEIRNPEKDFRTAVSGDGLAYTTVIGLKPDLSSVEQNPTMLTEERDEGSSDDETQGSDDEDRGENAKPGRSKNETAEERRERKHAVKEAKAERRKEKMPKHVKKRKVKTGKTHLK